MIRKESQTPPPLLFDSDVPVSPLQSTIPAKRPHEEVDVEVEVRVDKDHEPWEEELGKIEAEARTVVRGWKELQDQIKKHLKKNHHTLLLKQYNQLIIL